MSSKNSTIGRSRYSEVWDKQQLPSFGEIICLRKEIDPRFLPSGISGFVLHEFDHIAIFVEKESDDHLSLIARFIVAGYRNARNNEILSLELSQKKASSEAASLVDALLEKRHDNRLDIRDSDRNYGDYEPEHFTLEGMWHAMQSERDRMDNQNPAILRCASEDCSAFLGWLDNPHEYLIYESRLSSDLRRILPSGNVQLCVFKLSSLNRMGSELHLDTNRAIEEILISHSRIIYMSQRGLVFDREARLALRSMYPLPFGRRLLIRWRAMCTKVLAATLKRPKVIK